MSESPSCFLRSRVVGECTPDSVCRSVGGGDIRIESAMPGTGAKAPSPMELLVMSLLHCVGMSFTRKAGAEGHAIDKIRTEAVFEVDAAHGLRSIDTTYIVEGDVEADAALRLLREAESFSPVLKSLSGGTGYKSSFHVIS